MRVRPLVEALRQGDALARVVALRSADHAVRVAVHGAAVRTGVLDELVEAPLSVEELAVRHGWEPSLTEPFLQVLAAHRVLRRRRGRWSATKRGRRVAGDDVVRAVYEAFSDYHTGLYGAIQPLLAGELHRADIAEKGELIARLSRAMDGFIAAELADLVAEAPPSRVLDVGCGSGGHLVTLLRHAPAAVGVGVETDRAAAALAQQAVTDVGAVERAEVVCSDIRDFLVRRPGDRFDLVLLANVIYYVALAERVELLEALVDRLSAGGRLVVVTTALTDSPFSRHFDLLLRGHPGAMELPDVDVLVEQMTQAGLVVDPARRIAPREPLTVVVGRRKASEE